MEPSDTSNAIDAPLHADGQCMYKGKRCLNPRVVLPDGTQLRLCEYHRERINYNHRGWLERQRQSRERNSVGSRGSLNVGEEKSHGDDWLALAEQMRSEDEAKEKAARGYMM